MTCALLLFIAAVLLAPLQRSNPAGMSINVNTKGIIQVKTDMRWINNRNFDGIHSAARITDNGMAHLSAGIVWKLGTKKKIDHLLYASTRRYVSPPVVPIAQPIVKEVEKVVEAAPASVEKVEQMEVKVAELQMPLPTVHFNAAMP